MNKKNIKAVNVKDKRCLVRVDFNVPLDDNSNVTDDNRIAGAMPTISHLLDNGAKIILMSHLGRPKGRVNPKFSMLPAAKKLEELLQKDGRHVNVKLATDVVGEDAQRLVREMKNGEIVMLENLRFHTEEEDNEEGFCKKLASLCDIYINDAFGTAHRAHASTAGITAFVKDAVCGMLIEKELEFLGGALENPQRPFVAILGGSKVSDKIEVISNLIKIVDTLIIGGGMAYTFLAAQGKNVGNSLCETDKIGLAKQLIETAQAKNIKLLLPVDHVAAQSFSNDAPFKTVREIPDDFMGLDIGQESLKLFEREISKAKLVVWNGPMGVFEMSNFANGTMGIAQAVANSNAISIIGGGDSAAAVISMGFKDKMSHISTGGGASLEFLEGKKLPGIECLNEADGGSKK